VGDTATLTVAKESTRNRLKTVLTVLLLSSDAALALHPAVLHLRREVPLDRWVPFVHFGL